MNHPIEPGTVIASKYRIERALSHVGPNESAGLASVYLAWHEILQQNVALKILSPELASEPEVTSRFLNEARAAVRLRNEHVVVVMDVGTEEGTPYIVLEHLEGENLETILQKRGPLPPKEVVDWVLQVLEAVAHAHAQKIIHRDLKPSKLFVTKKHDGTAMVKVLDFGLAKITSGLQGAIATKTTAMLGSPAFMSPEQLRSAKNVDPRADVWSIGVVLFHLVTGKFPFEGESDGEIFASIIEKPAAKLRSVKADAPEDLERVIAKCLSRSLDERYANVGELALALGPLASPQGAPSVDRICRTLGVAPPPPPPPAAAAATPAAKPTSATPLIKFANANASKNGSGDALTATTVTDAPDHPLAATIPHQMEAPKLPPPKPEKPIEVLVPKPPTSQALIKTVGGSKRRELTGLVVVVGLAAVIGLGYFAWTSTRRDPPVPNVDTTATATATTATSATIPTATFKPQVATTVTSTAAASASAASSATRPTSGGVVPRPHSSKTDDPTTNPLLLQRN
ncbi:MAG TPA: serine/threonine-protein kinase [Polyangiaceae bacterium]